MSAPPQTKPPPIVFISYAHESDALRVAVRMLADWLGQQGCKLLTDHAYSYRPPPEGWQAWMLGCIRQADIVLVVCTPTLRQRYEKTADPDSGRGATYEGAIVTQHIYDDVMRNVKFYPILPDGDSEGDIPMALKSWWNGHRFPGGNEGIRRMIFDEPVDTALSPLPHSVGNPSGMAQINGKRSLRKREPGFLSSLIGKEEQFKPIAELGLGNGNRNTGRALAFVLADFSLECPDALPHKLHFRLRHGDDPGITVISPGDMGDGDAATYLWQLIADALHTRSSAPADIASHLNQENQSQILIHTLSGPRQKDRRFVAELVEAWEGLPVAADRPTHYLLLVNEAPEPRKVSWWAHWRLCRWIRAVECVLKKNRIISAGSRVLRPSRSPSVELEDVLLWARRDLPKFDFDVNETMDIHQLAHAIFSKAGTKLPYVVVRPQLKGQLDKLINPTLSKRNP